MATERQRGFTLIEVMLVVLIVGLLGSIAIPSLNGAVKDAQRAALINDARALHVALTSYRVDNSAFPTKMSVKTYAPISDLGYFKGGPSLNAKLSGGRPQFYMVTPGGSQYFSFMKMASDPNVTVVVASTSLLPGICVDAYCDGVYLIVDGEMVPVDQGD